MPFNPTSPIRGFQSTKPVMSSPRATSPSELRDALIRSTPTASSTNDASRPTTRSNYASNTADRARQNWRSSISSAVGSLRRSNAASNPARLGLISAPIRRLSASTTNDSPTDPALIPSSSTAIELSASTVPDRPITGPDEQRSFLDVDSDDSSDNGKPYTQPIVSRASSVRVQRPTVVQNKSGNGSSAGSDMTIQITLQGPIRSPPVNSVSRPMSTHEEVFEDLPQPKTPATETTNESTRGMGPDHAYKTLTANAPSSQGVSRFSASTVDSPLPTDIYEARTMNSATGGPAAALKALAGDGGNVSITAMAHTKDHSLVKQLASDSVFGEPVLEEQSVLAQPVTKPLFGEIVETLIETPDTPTALSTLPTLFGGFGAMRRQMLGAFSPLDLNPVDTGAASLHRAISAPPLPHPHLHRKVTIRPSDLVIADSRGNHKLFRDQVVSTPYPARNGSFANLEEALAEKRGLSDEKSDRFPSPNRAEVLVLQLAAARHAGMKKTIAIEIADRGSFDDEQLFKSAREAYNNDLLGPARKVFSARQLSHATFSNDISFDAEDFIKHLKQPKLGYKRKGWLLWLQQHQSVVANSPEDRNRDSYTSYYSPSSIPRMPFQRSLPLPPKVTLHFEFSILAIALAVLLCLLLSSLATMFWVLFGVPDLEAGLTGNWQSSAEGRVLTGLVLGILVLSLSSLGSAFWIGGSYVLL